MILNEGKHVNEAILSRQKYEIRILGKEANRINITRRWKNGDRSGREIFVLKRPNSGCSVSRTDNDFIRVRSPVELVNETRVSWDALQLDSIKWREGGLNDKAVLIRSCRSPGNPLAVWRVAAAKPAEIGDGDEIEPAVWNLTRLAGRSSPVDFNCNSCFRIRERETEFVIIPENCCF